METRLMIVSASSRVVGPVTEAVPAIDRYDGIMVRILKKYIREGYLHPREILFVSPIHGLIRAADPIQYHAPSKGDWRHVRLNESNLQKMNHAALYLSKKLTESREISEIYINVGKRLYPIIAGIENTVPCRIVYASGSGPGPKAAHMKDWLLSKRRSSTGYNIISDVRK